MTTVLTVAACAIAIFVISLSADGAAAESGSRDPGYRLLSLDGHRVKWGGNRSGTPAVIRYAFLSAALSRPGAVNCGEMRPIAETLSARRIPFDAVVAEFRAAFDSWEAEAGVRFEPAASGESADLVIGLQARPRGIAYADIAPRKTYVLFGATSPAAICLNPIADWETAFDGDDLTYDIRYVAVHETGHILGLDHAGGREGRIMSFGYRELFRVPQSGDIAGMRYLYGPPGSQPSARNAGIVPVSLDRGQSRP